MKRIEKRVQKLIKTSFFQLWLSRLKSEFKRLFFLVIALKLNNGKVKILKINKTLTGKQLKLGGMGREEISNNRIVKKS